MILCQHEKAINQRSVDYFAYLNDIPSETLKHFIYLRYISVRLDNICYTESITVAFHQCAFCDIFFTGSRPTSSTMLDECLSWSITTGNYIPGDRFLSHWYVLCVLPVSAQLVRLFLFLWFEIPLAWRNDAVTPLLTHWSYCSLITMTSWWARWRLKSPASRLFTQPFIRA